MSRFFIINAYGRSNRGDSVLLEECIAEIRAVDDGAEVAGAVFEGMSSAAEAHPDVAWSERIGNNEGGTAFAKLIGFVYILFCFVEASLPVLQLTRLIPPQQRASFTGMKKSDYIISSPGGYIHDTNLAYFVALSNIHIGLLLGKPVILAPQSIGPIKMRIGLWYARFVLARCELVCVREGYSRQFCLKALKLSPDKVVTTGDSAFWNTKMTVGEDEVGEQFAAIGVELGHKPILGVTFVGWNFPHSPDPAGDYDRYVQAMARILDRLCDTHDCLPVAFNQVDGDIPTSQRAAALMRHKLYVDQNRHEPMVLRAMIARSSAFIGTRFHSCVFAMMADIPTVAIAYLPKTQYIMADLRIAERFTSISTIDEDHVVDLIDGDLRDPDAARQRIRDACETYRTTFQRLSNAMARLVSAKPGAVVT